MKIGKEIPFILKWGIKFKHLWIRPARDVYYRGERLIIGGITLLCYAPPTNGGAFLYVHAFLQYSLHG
jgi:hypothetical protein